MNKGLSKAAALAIMLGAFGAGTVNGNAPKYKAKTNFAPQTDEQKEFHLSRAEAKRVRKAEARERRNKNSSL